MMKKRKYGIGFDIGVGSVGFAVLSWTDEEDARIETLGARLFASGETADRKASLSQERRGYRSARRLIRRRKHRKDRVKFFLQKIGLISKEKLQAWQEVNGNQNVLRTRLQGLTEKLTPEEIADTVIHICNHRGYREFYEDENDDKDAGLIKTGLSDFEKCYHAGGYKSVADMLLHDEKFQTETEFTDYHNHKNGERYILIKREYVRDELLAILRRQQQFYPQLNDSNIEFLCDEIIFAQRDFETGPGNPNDEKRKFMGFLDTLGKCMFYKTEDRAFRSTVLADIYSLVNCLSQMSFVDTATGEIVLPEAAAEEIINTALINGGMTESDLKKLLKKYGIEMRKPGKLEVKLPDTVKTLKALKNILEQCGYSYEELIAENQFDLARPSRLQLLCEDLSKNITPQRRKKVLAKAGWNKELQQAMLRKKFGGTASVCKKYMLEAINAFRHGETYGNFQARRLQERAAEQQPQEKHLLLPPLTMKQDEEVTKNIVVFKAINETRKVLNAIIRRYGSPEYINIEVADDLGRSVSERMKLTKMMRDNEKERQKIAEKIIELGLRKEGEVKEGDIARYKLWQEQGGIDLYSGDPIAENAVLSGIYDIDHIVPFSLILDDTLQNKALVNMGANRQGKHQQVPLQYLQGEQKTKFLQNVNLLFKKGKISAKKYKYLLLPNLYNAEVLAEWKSRNINDTRYITRYIVNYLTANLKFANEDKKKHVYAVKGAITSRMRKKWLNKKSWGSVEKDRSNNLHHAADALVIANLTPAYVEIVSDNMKLNKIYREHHKQISFEYNDYLEKAVKKMQKYYGFNEAYARKLLEAKGRIPSIIKNLEREADIRLTDESMEFYQDKDASSFAEKAADFYRDDPQFAAGLRMPLVSYKQNKKFQGKITDDNPVKKAARKNTSLVKLDTLGNENILTASKYYCVELYETADGKNNLRGIRYADLKKQGKKLYLTAENPADYKRHKMYLFANDYIEVINQKGECKFKGFYKSVFNINENRVYCNEGNTSKSINKTIAAKDIVKKYNIDILGEMGGEMKCSVPFMLLREKK